MGVFRFLQRLWRLVVDEHTGELKLGRDHPDDGDRAGAASDRCAGSNQTSIDWPSIPPSHRSDRVHQRGDLGSGRLTTDQVDRLIRILAPDDALHRGRTLASPGPGNLPWPTRTWPDGGRHRCWWTRRSNCPIQVKGKVRSKISVAADADEKGDPGQLPSPIHASSELIQDTPVRKGHCRTGAHCQYHYLMTMAHPATLSTSHAPARLQPGWWIHLRQLGTSRGNVP